MGAGTFKTLILTASKCDKVDLSFKIQHFFLNQQAF